MISGSTQCEFNIASTYDSLKETSKYNVFCMKYYEKHKPRNKLTYLVIVFTVTSSLLLCMRCLMFVLPNGLELETAGMDSNSSKPGTKREYQDIRRYYYNHAQLIYANCEQMCIVFSTASVALNPQNTRM